MRRPVTKVNIRLSYIAETHDEALQMAIEELERVIRYLREHKPKQALVRTPLTHLWEPFSGQYTGLLDFEWRKPQP